MVNNLDRAKWAEIALSAFASECMPGELTDETAIDLICAVGHFCKSGLKLSDDEVIAIYRYAIGAWKAENDSPLCDPIENANVTIEIFPTNGTSSQPR